MDKNPVIPHQNLVDRGEDRSLSLLQRYMQLPWYEKISMAIHLGLGILLRPKLDTKGWIIAGAGVKITKRNGSIHVDRLCSLGSSLRIAVVGQHRKNPAVLKIGYNTQIMDRTKINVGTSVVIGRECNISWDCDILDNDFHCIIDENGQPSPITKPIVIEDHVWIGCNSVILKGVVIGNHSVIAAGSVVASDVHPYTLVGGNPAKLIKRIGGWSRRPLPSESAE